MLALFATVAMVSLVHGPPNTPPSIGTPVTLPASPGPGDIVTVMVNVTDNQLVNNVTVVYTTDNWQSVNTTITAVYNATTHAATAQIPSLTFGGHVAYYIVAFDNAGNKAVNDNNGSYFTYDVPAPSPTSVTTLAFVGVLAAVGAGVGLMAYMMLKKPSAAKTHATSGSGRDPY